METGAARSPPHPSGRAASARRPRRLSEAHYSYPRMVTGRPARENKTIYNGDTSMPKLKQHPGVVAASLLASSPLAASPNQQGTGQTFTCPSPSLRCHRALLRPLLGGPRCPRGSHTGAQTQGCHTAGGDTASRQDMPAPLQLHSSAAGAVGVLALKDLCSPPLCPVRQLPSPQTRRFREA